MHQFLCAIGLGSLKNKKEMMPVIAIAIENGQRTTYYSAFSKTNLAEYRYTYGEKAGITVCGEFVEDDDFHVDYYFPYIEPTYVSSTADISLRMLADKNTYLGLCEDPRVGVSLIFFLQNSLEYRKLIEQNAYQITGNSLMLVGLAAEGSILLPLQKSKQARELISQKSKKRNEQIMAAKDGDMEARQALNLEDMDTMSDVARRMYKEDIYSFVDESFMPSGLESDQYSVLVEILQVEELVAPLSKKELYYLTVVYNTMVFSILIDKNDLNGEPAKGRRFKGTIWLQGYMVTQ